MKRKHGIRQKYIVTETIVLEQSVIKKFMDLGATQITI
jgi:hypothetical protein